MTTPHIDSISLLKRITALESLVTELRESLEIAHDRIDALMSTRGGTKSAQIEQDKAAIMEFFQRLPRGLKMNVPTIAENMDTTIERNAVNHRVNSLVQEGKLKRHQEEGKNPTFSLLS